MYVRSVQVVPNLENSLTLHSTVTCVHAHVVVRYFLHRENSKRVQQIALHIYTESSTASSTLQMFPDWTSERELRPLQIYSKGTFPRTFDDIGDTKHGNYRVHIDLVLFFGFQPNSQPVQMGKLHA